MAHAGQVCFMDNGQMFCNAIWKHGKLIYNKSGKWFRFIPKDRKEKAKEDVVASSDAK